MPPELAPADCAELLLTTPAVRDAIVHHAPPVRGLMELVTLKRCADAIEVTEEHLRDEIHRGRLVARRYVAPSGHQGDYRIDPDDWTHYVVTVWPRVVADPPPAA